MPVFYADAQGQHKKKQGKHSLLLPHEIIGSFFDFQHVDLMEKLIGKPDVSWLQTGQNPNAHSVIYLCTVSSLLKDIKMTFCHYRT